MGSDTYPDHWRFDEVFDSLNNGCGDFLLDLRQAVRKLESGATLMVSSHDAGAPREIPAWCRLCGHRLLEAVPPYYLIRKRSDSPQE